MLCVRILWQEITDPENMLLHGRKHDSKVESKSIEPIGPAVLDHALQHIVCLQIEKL